MADSKLLAPELSDAESMGEETVRFQELLLKVRADWWEPGYLWLFKDRSIIIWHAEASVPRMPYGIKKTYGNCSCLARGFLDFKRKELG